LEKSGYEVKSRIYNFAGFGLPQERFRAVMLAMKVPFQMPDPPLTPDQFVTVRQAIGHLPPLQPGAASPTDPMHRTSSHRPSTIEILKQIPLDGGNRPIGVGPACLDRAREEHGGYTDVYGRLAWDRPSVTITARCRTPSCGRFAHPKQHRGLSIREAALLQGFPPDFVFEGGFDDKYKQIGNAVPPLVAHHFAEHLIRLLSGQRPVLGTSDHDLVEVPIGPGFAVTINGIKRRRTKQTEESEVRV
jgi:DNA (cytosine-5)-methyltransferase 1